MIEDFQCLLDLIEIGLGVRIWSVWEDIPSKQLAKYKLPDDIERIFIDIDLRKAMWLKFRTYRPPSHPVE